MKRDREASDQTIARFPAHEAKDANPDTHLALTFPSPPTLEVAGQIRRSKVQGMPCRSTVRLT